MCHINTKSRIMNKGDLNSLVAGIIFRQCVPFDKAMIKQMVMYHSAGAQIDIEEKEIDKLINTRLDTLERNDFISFRRGQYYPGKVIYYV